MGLESTKAAYPLILASELLFKNGEGCVHQCMGGWMGKCVCVSARVSVCVFVAGGEFDLKCKEFVFAVDNGSLTGIQQEAL